MDEATPEEKLAIATKFLLSSPPGEFDVVLRDVRSVMGSDADLLGTRAEGVFRAYHTEQLHRVHHPDHPGEDAKAVVTARVNEIDARNYYDARSDTVVVVDHINSTSTGHRPCDSGETSTFTKGVDASLRSAVESLADKYVSENFSGGTVNTVGKSGELHVLTCATKASPRNFWSGRWRSHWVAEVGAAASGASVAVKGTLRVQAHYYEEGNVQLSGDQERSFAASGGSAEELAASIVEGIAREETEYQAGLGQTYLDMRALQSLRRKLPIHAEKFNWDNIAHSRLAGELKK